jgi:hypothetical protein
MSTSKRMEALIKAHRTGGIPRLAGIYAGWYKAPNGQRYFGFGKVVEIGITHDDSVYVNVEPAQDLPGSKLDFFDPFTDKDMPRDQYPAR